MRRERKVKKRALLEAGAFVDKSGSMYRLDRTNLANSESLRAREIKDIDRSVGYMNLLQSVERRSVRRAIEAVP